MALLKLVYLVTGITFVVASNELRVPVVDLTGTLDSSWFKTRPLDLNEKQQDIVQQIRRACHEVGFFQIIGAMDDSALLNETWKASKEFFALPSNEKLLHKTNDAEKYPYGYERSETLAKGKLLDGESGDETPASWQQEDLKETFALGPPDGNGSGMPPRRWIDSPNLSNFRNSLEAYYEHMEDLALKLLEIFAISLGENPTFFEERMGHHMSALRLVHYYPLERPPTLAHPYQQQENQQKPTRLIRAGAHTDYGALTILAAQDQGLEVLLRDNTVAGNEAAKQQWVPVPLVEGGFVVNLGDLMQRWTNGEWVSTMHRVVMPSTEAQERRYSMAYFVNINGDTPIEPLKCCQNSGKKHQAITAGEHLMAKHLASMGARDDEGEL